MKKALVVALTEEELQELYRILIDRDAEAALAFLQDHLRAPLLQAMEGG
jgi:DNA-binding GntR family transcriptional regulator